MRLTCYSLLSAAALAASLAACSTDAPDQASRSGKAPSHPTLTPASGGTPSAPVSAKAPRPAAAPTAKAAPSLPQAAAAPPPAAVGAGAAPAHRPAAWVSRAQPAATPRRPAATPAETPPPATPGAAAVAAGGAPVAAAAAASAPEATSPAVSAAGLTLGPVAAEAPAPGSLAAFCAQAAPAGQVYQVQPGRDTVLLGERGTRLVIPARAFDVPTGSRSVQLTLREFYSTPDIVLAGLGTRAGRDVLETGGMVHLYAAAGGQTVHLRAGMQLLVQLPTQQALPGMRLYEGVSADVSHAPDWQLPGAGSQVMARSLAANPTADPAALAQWVKLHPPKNPRWPRFDKGNEVLLKEFDRLMPDSKADQAYLRRKHRISPQEQQQLRELSRLNHTAIRHAIDFEVELDSTGALQKATLVDGDSTLAARVLAALQQLPRQQPASFMSRLPRGRRTVSTVQGTFTVLYARSGRRLVGFQWLLMDKQLQEEVALEARRGRTEFARQFDRAGSTLTLSSGLYYELAAGGLGWINCDRLLEPGPRILFTVQAPDPATVVSLVFKGQRSILASSRTEGSAAFFEQVPAGAAATVVALRRENGVTYLATSSVSLGEAVRPALEFRPVSLEQLRTELAAL